MAIELRAYQTKDGRQPFVEWLRALPDRQARARIDARLARVATGNFGDTRAVGEGVMELRIDWGSGYRLYFARLDDMIVLLLCGGDKRTQQKDIDCARSYFQDFKARSAKTRRGA